MTDTLYRDDLAYVDAFRVPLIPCKVLGASPEANSARVRLTAARPGYRRGEVLDVRTSHIIPRGNVRTVRGSIRVRSAVHIKLDETRPAE